MTRCTIVAVAVVLITALRVSGAAAAEKTLHRLHDPVVVPGAQLLGMSGRNTAQLRLYRFAGGDFVLIPRQFDARDRRGELVVDGPAEFVLDDNDELVFMAKDTGDEAPPGLGPPGAGATVEVDVSNVDHSERGWAYLAAVTDGTAHAGAEPYVVYDRRSNWARSAFYEVAYAPTRNFLTAMQVTRLGGGTGENLLRQTRMRGRPILTFFFTDFALEFTERNSIVAIDGVRNGPVRSVRRVRLAVDLGPMFPELPNGTAYTYHYATVFMTPTRFGVPWLALKTLRSFEFESVIDFNPSVIPLAYWDGANPQGAMLDGQPFTLHTDTDHEWWVHSSAAGTMLHAFLIPADWSKWGIVRGSVARGGGDGATPDEGVAAGYSLLHMTRLKEARTYDLLQAAFVLPQPYQPGDERAPMSMLRSPLHVSVRRLG